MSPARDAVVLSYAVSSAGFCHALTTSRNTFHSLWLVAQVSAYFLLAEASQIPAGRPSISFGLQQSPPLPHHSPGHLITVPVSGIGPCTSRGQNGVVLGPIRGCHSVITVSTGPVHSSSSINVGWVHGWMHPHSPQSLPSELHGGREQVCVSRARHRPAYSRCAVIVYQKD